MPAAAGPARTHGRQRFGVQARDPAPGRHSAVLSRGTPVGGTRPPEEKTVVLGGMRGTIIAVKATVDIRDELLAQARAQAARERTTLAAVVEEGLVLRLRSTAPRGGAMNPLPVSPRRGGLRPGIDGSCNRSLLDAADR